MMRKLIAVLNVVAWSGFWAFGYLALSAEDAQSGSVVMALVLAAIGAALGIFAYLWLVRYSEKSGYARGSNQLSPELRERAQAEWGN